MPLHILLSFLSASQEVPRTQEFKSRLPKNPELSTFLCLQPEAGQNIALHASPTAMNSTFLISASPVHSGSFNVIFPSSLQA